VPELCQVGIGNDGYVGKQQQPLTVGQLGHGNMGKHLSGRQQSVRFVKNGAEQVVRGYEPFEEQVGLAPPHGGYGFSGSLYGVGGFNTSDAVGKFAGYGLIE